MLRFDSLSHMDMPMQQLSEALNSISDGFIVSDNERIVRYINPAAQSLTGWLEQDAVGRALSSIFTHVEETTESTFNAALKPDGQGFELPMINCETMLKSRGGDLFPVEVSINPVMTDGNHQEGIVLTFRNISSKWKALLEIQHQAQRARTLTQTASTLNAELDLKSVLASICTLTNQLLGATATSIYLYDRTRDVYTRVSAVTGRNMPTAGLVAAEMPSNSIEALLTPIERIRILKRDTVLPEIAFENLSLIQGAQLIVLAGIFRQDEVMGFLNMMFLDPSDFVHGDAELIQGIADKAAISITNANLFEQVRQGRQRQHALAQSLVNIQEVERRYIARELHDHLGQSLTGLQFMLERAKNEIVDKKLDFEEMQLLVIDLIDQVREMSHKLRPSMLDDMGLIPTLHWHIERYTKQTGIFVHFRCDDSPQRFSTEVETTAYRIVQEALTNVARYAQAREVNVGISVQNATLWIEVTDKGRGFDMTEVRQKPTSGLGGMRERVDLAGGNLLIRSYENQGTQIIASLPLTDKPVERRKHERQDSSGG